MPKPGGKVIDLPETPGSAAAVSWRGMEVSAGSSGSRLGPPMVKVQALTITRELNKNISLGSLFLKRYT
jgi:hypothetical protein